MYQHTGVASQRSRVAGNIDDPSGQGLCLTQGSYHSDRTFTWRIDHHFVEVTLLLQPRLIYFEQVDLGKLCTACQPVAVRVFLCPTNQGCASLVPDHMGATPGDGQSEITQSAK